MSPPHVIDVTHLSRHFGTFKAVDDVNFHVEAGEIFGYLGANGAGKSTTIRMLCGLLDPTSGDAVVAGHRISQSPELVKRSIGYMSQRFSLYMDLPVEENIAFFGGAYGLAGKPLRDRRDELLKLVDLKAFLKTKTSELPGGIRQRLIPCVKRFLSQHFVQACPLVRARVVFHRFLVHPPILPVETEPDMREVHSGDRDFLAGWRP